MCLQILFALLFLLFIEHICLENTTNSLSFELNKPIPIQFLIKGFSQFCNVVAAVPIVNLVLIQEANNLHLPKFGMVIFKECAIQIISSCVRNCSPVVRCREQRVVWSIMAKYLQLGFCRSEKVGDSLLRNLLRFLF